MYSCNAAKREHPPPTSLYKREVHGETFILLFRLLKMNKANHFLVFHAAYSDGSVILKSIVPPCNNSLCFK